MAVQTIAKGLGIFGISPSVVEVFFTDHEDQVMKAKFADHLATEGISFDTEDEYNFRMQIFKENDGTITEWNNKQSSFTLSHNYLSTKTQDEIDSMKGIVDTEDSDNDVLRSTAPYPASVNWVTAGKVNAIQNQGMCGSCWAFSSIATMESHYAIATGKLLKLSEQQIVSCDKQPGANGCNGGNYGPAFSYAQKTPIVLEKEYPYQSGRTRKTGTCNTAMATNGQISVTSFSPLDNTIDNLKTHLALGPVGILVAASSNVWKNYHRGILDTTACGQKIDHAVTAVGYGTSKQGKDFLIVRNSWGARWGNKGYINIALNAKNICGTLSWKPYIPMVSEATMS